MKIHCYALLLASLGMTAAFAEDAPIAPPVPSAALEFVKIGMISKPLTAGGEAIAVLSAGGKDTPLIASGDLAKKLTDLAASNARATVTGTLKGEKMIVSKVEAETATAVDDTPRKKRKKEREENGEPVKKKKKKTE